MARTPKNQGVKSDSEKDLVIQELMARLEKLEGNQSKGDEREETTKIPLDDLIKVMSLLPYTLILNTQKGGQGREYRFESFGETKKILYRDLIDIMESRRHFMEDGYYYIMDNRVIREHGLQDIYSKILTKDKIEEILSGSNEAVELYNSCHEVQQKEIVSMIVEKLRDNPAAIDLNVVDKLSRVSGINITEKAEMARETLRMRQGA